MAELRFCMLIESSVFDSSRLPSYKASVLCLFLNPKRLVYLTVFSVLEAMSFMSICLDLAFIQKSTSLSGV